MPVRCLFLGLLGAFFEDSTGENDKACDDLGHRVVRTEPRHTVAATRLESLQWHKGAQPRGQMVMTITTAPSTAYDDAQLARRLPPDLLRTVLAYENELQRLQAQQPTPDTAKIEAMKKRANHAGAYKVMRLEAAVLDLVHDHRPQLEKWTDRKSVV